MESFLEILKYVLPALVVFLTAYFLLKQHLDERNQVNAMQFRTEQLRLTLPLRLQAYERFAIMLDRIRFVQLLARLRTPEMSVGELKMTLMLAIQQEFDHNSAQQIYISDTISKIINLAKEGSQEIVLQASEALDSAEKGEKLVNILLSNLERQDAMIFKSLQALRMEAGSHF
jgi:hypothetical protein